MFNVQKDESMMALNMERVNNPYIATAFKDHYLYYLLG